MGYNFRPFQFLHCNAFSEGIFSRPAGNGALGNAEQDTQGFLKNLALLGLRSIYVDHCHEAYGLVIHGHSGWSIVYSGDTRPCHRLIQAGGGCSLLIHEATFEDNLSDHAIRKRHSTVLEAIDVGLQMRAQFVVLTHFSQRYPQVRPSPENLFATGETSKWICMLSHYPIFYKLQNLQYCTLFQTDGDVTVYDHVSRDENGLYST